MRPRLLPVIAGALALAGTLVIASTVGTAQPQQRAAKPNVCTSEQRTIIDTAFRRAEVRIAQAIAFLDANPEHKHFIRWFGDTRRKLVRHNLTLIQEGLREGRRPEIACNPPARCVAFAFIRPGHLTLCPLFFNSRTEGQDAHYGILIHEISHLVAGTRDAAYQPFAAALLAQREPVTAATNADNYEYFVEFLPQ